jgi:hypothetical protein
MRKDTIKYQFSLKIGDPMLVAWCTRLRVEMLLLKQSVAIGKTSYCNCFLSRALTAPYHLKKNKILAAPVDASSQQVDAWQQIRLADSHLSWEPSWIQQSTGTVQSWFAFHFFSRGDLCTVVRRGRPRFLACISKTPPAPTGLWDKKVPSKLARQPYAVCKPSKRAPARKTVWNPHMHDTSRPIWFVVTRKRCLKCKKKAPECRRCIWLPAKCSRHVNFFKTR